MARSSYSTARFKHIGGGIEAILNIIYGLIAVLCGGTALIMFSFARDKKFRISWLLFGFVFIFVTATTAARSLDIIRDSQTDSMTFVQLSIIGSFAWILALSLLSRANYEDRLNKQNRGIVALNEMAKSYLSGEKLSEKANSALDELSDSFNADGGIIFGIHRKEKRVEILAEFGDIPRHAVELATKISLRTASGGKIIQRMVEMDTDLKKIHEKYTSTAREEGFKSIMGFPIRVEDSIFGMMVLFSKKKVWLSEQDRTVLNLVAFEIGMWISRLRNVNKLRRMAKIQKGLIEDKEREKQRAQIYLDLLTHDIANLNTPLCTYYDFIMEDEKIGKTTRQLLTKSNQLVHKINDLLARIRKISKAESVKKEDLQPVDIRAMLSDATEALKKSFPHKDLKIKLQPGKKQKFIAIAGEMLDEIFFNILQNSIRNASGDEIRIDISLKNIVIDGDPACNIQICDYGTGFSDEEKENIFSDSVEPAASFARGFGIGLSTCKKFLEQYGGTISVADRILGNPSQGACFIITLPLAGESIQDN